MKEAYFKGKIVPFADAKIGVMTHAFNYGTGCFEGIRGYWNVSKKHMYILQMREHYERLLRSCRVLRINVRLSLDELCSITTELAKRHAYQEDIYIRPIAYKSQEKIGLGLIGVEDDLTIYIAPFGEYLDVSRGIKVCISTWRRVDDNAIPARAKITGIYVNSSLAKAEAIEGGFAEAIMLTPDGHVSEGTGENVFIVRNGNLITPPVSDNILEGITRASVMALAEKELGIKTIERSIDRTELYTADEFFLCGTGAQIAPVLEIDRRSIANGEIGSITKKLQALYFQVARGENPAYAHWLTSAY